MTQTIQTNRRFVLAQRPVGAPDENTLRLETSAIPEPVAGQMLLRTVYLSLDPYMRGRMSAAKSYADPVAIGDVMVGGTVARVVKSNLAGFEAGDWVLSYSGWQDYALSDGTMVTNLGKTPEAPSWALGVLGMPGLTAYSGLLQIGDPKPGETVIVASATGPVGSTVGQIAKIKGARAVGIAGGKDKCEHAVKELGFDVCVDRYADDFAEQLAAACPDGVDVYFENVGGDVFKALLPLFNTGARIPLCGLIAQYNRTEAPKGPDFSGAVMGTFLTRRMKVQGFIVFPDFGHLYPEFAKDMTAWVKEGKVKYTEQIVDGLENAPSAFNDLLEGRNFGKLVIKVGEAEL